MAYAANKTGIGSLQSLLESQRADLESTKASAEAAKTRSAFDGYKDDFGTALASYNSNVGMLGNLTDTYGNVQTARKISSSLMEIPNFKDPSQWLPGGTLKNLVGMPGGNIGVESVPTLGTDKPASVDPTALLLAGNLTALLNTGYTSVVAKSLGGVLDLIADFDIRSTAVVSYRVVVDLGDGSSPLVLKDGTYVSSGGNDGGGGDGAGSVSSGRMSLDSIASAYANRSDLRTAAAAPKTFAMSLMLELAVGAYNGTLELGSIQDYAAGMALGTVQNIVSEKLASMAVKALGITSVPVAIAVSIVVGMVVDELTEISLGLDNSFGFGGEILGTDSTGLSGMYGPTSSFSKGIVDTVLEAVSLGYVDTDTYNPETGLITDITGGIIGYGVKPMSVEEMLGYENYDENTGLSFNADVNSMYGIDVTGPVNTAVDTSFTDSYFGSQTSGNEGNGDNGDGQGGRGGPGGGAGGAMGGGVGGAGTGE